MLESKPTRPKRQPKAPPKDQSGLLISVIRALSKSQNIDERDREKRNLEKNFKQSDEKLEALVYAYRDQLTQILSTFSRVPLKISDSRQRLATVKDKLNQCRTLLSCKRDEVKNRWLEVMEHKHELKMLDEIENLMTVPDRLKVFTQRHQYLFAAQLLVTSALTLEGPLKSVEALNEVKTEIANKSEEIFQLIMADIHKHIYEISTMNLVKKKKNKDFDANFDFFEENKKEMNDSLFEEKLDGNPEDDSRSFIAAMIYSLFLLKRIPDAIDHMKNYCQKEMIQVVWKSRPLYMDMLPLLPGTSNLDDKNSAILLGFINFIFEQIKGMLALHQWIVIVIKYLGQEHQLPYYDLSEIWSKVQGLVEMLAREYLDLTNATAQTVLTSVALSDITTDINYYFSKKRIVRQRQLTLFRFDCSSHAISMNEYIREQKEILIKQGDYWEYSESTQHQYVCQPASKNIVVIFNPTMDFIRYIDKSLELPILNPCPLASFVTESVKIFLNELTSQIDGIVDSAIKSMENRRMPTDIDYQKNFGLQKPILQSTLMMNQSLEELTHFLISLPIYSNHFLSLICKILSMYKDSCYNSFRGLVQHESQEKRIISATWAKDEDISRYLKSLPTWINLRKFYSSNKVSSIEESPEEVSLRNKKVSEILTFNITGDTLIPQHEILNDLEKLRILAQLHESMEWFGNQILELAKSLPTAEKNQKISPKFKSIEPFASSSLEPLYALAHDFDNLAETCLLVLYLEVRVHCFYHLLPITTKGFYPMNAENQEPDIEVTKLIKDLTSIEEELEKTLQSRKFKCIFEGIGHLLSSIFINYVGAIKKINEFGIKRMCKNIFVLQQTLTSITKNREVALERARQYYELIYLSTEEVLNSILENGPQYQELEYTNLLKLIQNNLSPKPDAAVAKKELDRLLEILNKVSVQL